MTFNKEVTQQLEEIVRMAKIRRIDSGPNQILAFKKGLEEGFNSDNCIGEELLQEVKGSFDLNDYSFGGLLRVVRGRNPCSIGIYTAKISGLQTERKRQSLFKYVKQIYQEIYKKGKRKYWKRIAPSVAGIALGLTMSHYSESRIDSIGINYWLLFSGMGISVLSFIPTYFNLASLKDYKKTWKNRWSKGPIKYDGVREYG